MKDIEILQVSAYPAWDEKPLNEKFTMHRYFDAEDKAALVDAHHQNIRGIATSGTFGADRQLIEALPNLEVISVYGVGYDAVDIEAAKERGIRVTNTPDVLSGDVADLGIAMVLAQSRKVVGADEWVRNGNWENKGPFDLTSRVHGQTAGVLGLGSIGFQVAKRLAAFDLDIAYSATAAKPHVKDWTFIADPVELAKRSKFLFVTLSANDATRHIVDQKAIEAVGPDGMIINLSRASTIDEEAMLGALEDGRLGSAALDVFEGEPSVNPRFLKLDNVLLQPHHASGTTETRKAMGKLVYDNLVAHFEGKALLTPVV
jgi:lactate dehydrogenase-like 2-hydroxyacid dehydrogenase